MNGVVGRVVKSKSGHDKGKFYCVVAVLDDKHVAVADGQKRTLQVPKKKNLRHLEITGTVFEGLKRLLTSEPVSSNLELRGWLKAFKKESFFGEGERRCN